MIDIYEALKSGQTPDAIAQSFVDELNAAIAKQEADKAAAAAEAKKQEQKEKDTQAVIDCINAYLAVYYPEVQPVDAEFLNTTIEANRAANELLDTLKKDPKALDAAIDDIFSNFFTKFDI